MPCQVPSARRPSRTGSVSDGPGQRRLDVRRHVVGALERVRPRERPRARPCRTTSQSRRTSGEAFSFSVSDADVCRSSRWQSPTRSSPSSGSAPSTSRVTRWKPRGRGSRTISRWIHIAAPSCHAHVDAPRRRRTARPRPRAARAGARPWRATRRRARSRCHGTAGSSHADSTVPAKRGAPGRDVAVGGDEALAASRARGRARRGAVGRGRADGARRRVDSQPCAAAPTRSSPATRATGELGVAVQSHWFSVGPIVPWARPGVGAVATQSIAEPAYGPRLLDRLAAGELRRRRSRRELAGRSAGAATARSPSSTPTAASAVHTGERCIAFAGHERGDAFSAQANMMAAPRSGRRWRAPSRRPPGRCAPPARGAARGRGARRRRARAPVGGAARTRRAGRAGGRASTSGSGSSSTRRSTAVVQPLALRGTHEQRGRLAAAHVPAVRLGRVERREQPARQRPGGRRRRPPPSPARPRARPSCSPVR